MTDTLRRTPLAERHVALGARMVPFAGWEMPVQYAGIKKEHAAVRESAGLFDVSHMGELWLRGPEALAAVDALVTNAVHSLPVGKAMYTCCCKESGGILDDLIIYRVGDEEVLIVCNASNRGKISPHVEKAAQGKAEFEDASDATALMAIQGPKAVEVVASLPGGAALAEMGPFAVQRGTLAGVEILAARTGYTGEDGFELFCKNDDAVTLFDALIGHDDVSPAGLGCRDTLRLEARLSLYGNELDEDTTPYEAGLGWVVKLDGPDFVGKAALEKQKAEGVKKKLVGIEMRGKGIARHGYPVLIDGEVVGVITSGSPGPTVGKNIALAYVPKANAKRGTQLAVEIRGKHVDAEIVRTPVYKRSR